MGVNKLSRQDFCGNCDLLATLGGIFPDYDPYTEDEFSFNSDTEYKYVIVKFFGDRRF